MKRLWLGGLAGLLAGCGFFGMDPLTPRLQITDPEAVRRADVLEICGHYGATGGVSRSSLFGVNPYEITKAELIRRQTFTDEEWAQIGNREVVVGMSKCAVLAAIGEPRYDYPSRHKHLGDNVRDNVWVYNFNWYRGDLGLGSVSRCILRMTGSSP
jgi:hypothetical protein